MSIPKLAYTYWSGERLPYLHVLTIKSLCYFNTDYEIIIYTSKRSDDVVPALSWSTGEHALAYSELFDFSALGALNNIDIRYVDIRDYIQTSHVFTDTHIADAFRILNLKEHGRVWFDFDILFIQPLCPILFISHFVHLSPTALSLVSPSL